MDHMLKPKGVFSWISTLTRSSSWRQHLPTLRHTNSLMQLKTPPMSSYSQCGKLHNTMQNKNNGTKSTGRNYLMHPPMTIVANNLTTTRYDTRCYFNVRSKANTSQLNLHTEPTTKTCKNRKTKSNINPNTISHDYFRTKQYTFHNWK